MYWSTSPQVSPTNGTKVAGLTSSPFVHTDPATGTTYHYVVTAVRDGQESEPSGPASVTATGAIGIDPSRPMPDQLVGEMLAVEATITSLYALSEVKATVGDRSVLLAYSSSDRTWRGALSLTGLGRGEKRVTIRARDVRGGVGEISRPFRFDLPPGIEFLEPIDATVTTPSLRVVIRCTDDDPEGCRSLRVTRLDGGATLALETNGVDRVLSLGPAAGRDVVLFIYATDSAGQITTARRRVHVVSSFDRLAEIARVSGRVLDVRGDRILHLHDVLARRVDVHDRASGTTTTIHNEPGLPEVAAGFLTPAGAFFSVGGFLRDWRDGATTQLEILRTRLKVVDRWAAYNSIRRDLIDGSVISVNGSELDVAANGDLVYNNQGNIERYRDGVVTPIALRDQEPPWVSYGCPRTEGSVVVFKAWSGIDSGVGQIRMVAASGEHTLATGIDFGCRFASCNSVAFDVNAGWVGYLKSGAQGIQIWVRSPAGAERQLTDLGSEPAIDGVGPAGEVVYHSVPLLRRWISRPDGSDSVEIPYHPDSRMIFRDRKLLMLLGRSVFEVSY